MNKSSHFNRFDHSIVVIEFTSVKLNGELIVEYQYNENGQVSEIKDVRNGVSKYFTYDFKGKLIKVVNSENNIISYNYDNLDNVQKTSYKLGDIEKSFDFEYDYETNEYTKEGYFNRIEKEFCDEINSLDLDNEILKMILNYEEIEQQDIWKIKNYEYLCNKWKDEYLEEYRKRYKQVSEILKDLKTSEIDKLKIALNKKEINGLIKQINYINYNLLYNKDRKLKAINKDMLVVFRIRDFINKIKDKERGVYLSNKFKTELLQELLKEKSLSKLTPISLDKHLKLIYILSNNNNNERISSVKNSV